MGNIERLEAILKHKFKKPELLHKALVHSSVNPHADQNYERLEFLGDRVLGVSIASLLYRIFSHEPEGNLSQRFTGLVCRETVAQVGRTLHLGDFMIVGNEDIRENESVLCDVCEAVIGAIYIDAGVEGAINFVNNHWRELIDRNVAPPKDSKTLLQETAHVKNLGQPVYRLIGRSGSEHEPVFEIAVSMEGAGEVVGHGRNKKAAEFDAAAKMLEQIS